MVTSAFNQNAIDPGAAELLGQELLKEVAGGGNLNVIDSYIKRGASLASVDDKGNTAALLATQQKNDAVAEKLLAAGSDPNATNKQGLSGLAYLSMDGPHGQGNSHLARVYLDHNANPDITYKGIAVLAWAARIGFRDVAMAIGEKADIGLKSGNRNLTAIEWAEDNNKNTIARDLRALAERKRDAAIEAERAAQARAAREAEES
ncbi:MAG TPA: hypothetical protein VEF76_07780, partial [Patescibacteria group bacterium]|nr:hypothetical protein [Patescibacteria group bacterium]